MKEKKTKNQTPEKPPNILKVVCYILIFIYILFSASLIWEKGHFGSAKLSAIIFTMTMPLEDGSSSYVYSYILTALIPSILIFILLLVLYRKFKKHLLPILVKKTPIKKKWFNFGRTKATALIAFMFILIIITSELSLKAGQYVMNQFVQSKFIETNYVEPSAKNLKFPKKKRNLIYIFMESAETTQQDKKSGGKFDRNVIPEMTQLEKENISFSQNNKFEGAYVAANAGWTMAGMVAEQSGLPLKTYAYDNSMGHFKHFLPGAKTIGDLLRQQGYTNFFMCGSTGTFAGTDNYYREHGKYRMFDYYTAVKKKYIKKDYKRKLDWWGVEDAKLYDYAKIELTNLAKAGKPFNFNMATMDTHAEEGKECQHCEHKFKEKYANVWRCASKQLYGFIDWIKRQDFYKNTTVVVCGDHLSMAPDFFEDHGITESQRYVYNVFINSVVGPANDKNRKFTTMDIFPSTLAAMGVKIEGNRLGLGTNLFSNEKTLAEKVGYKKLDEEIEKKSEFFDKNILYEKEKGTKKNG